MDADNNTGNYGYSEELALFEKPVLNGGVQKVRWIEYRPVNQITQDGSIDFIISGNGSSYVDLRRTYLYVKAKVVRHDDTPLPPPRVPDEHGLLGEPSISAKVAPVNLWLHSLFSQVDVYLQQKLVTSSNSSYFIKAYIDSLLKCCGMSREVNLQAQMYFKDNCDAMEDSDPFSGMNSGIMLREKFIRESRSVDMEGPLLVDIFQCDRYLLNGIEIRIKLWPTKSSLNLMAVENLFKSVLEDVTLKVCHVTPTPQVITAHQETLNKKYLALYPYSRSEIKKFTVGQGAFDFTKDDVFQNLIPTRLILCMVNNESLSGSFQRNPFNFKNYNVNFVEVSVDGESVPSRALQTKFGNNEEDGNYVDAYLSMTRGVLMGQEEHSITREDYNSGYTFFVFDLEPELLPDKENDEEFWPLVKHGNLRIEFHFDTALPETITLIAYGIFPRIIKIDNVRSVLLE
jgi:hypothetical protein